MLLIPTAIVNEKDGTRMPCTVDADKLCLYGPLLPADGPLHGTSLTRIVFDNGTSVIIDYDFNELMQFLAEQDDDAEPSEDVS